MSRRLLAYLGVGLVPWSLVSANGVVSYFFQFGILNLDPFQLVDPVSYLTVKTLGLPTYLLAWPLGAGLYALGLASVVMGVLTGAEDRRLSAGLFVLAALTQVQFVLGFLPRRGYSVVPLGAVCCLLVVWWFDWPALRRSLSGFDRMD